MKDGIVIYVADLGNVPALKNNKLLTRGRLITNPKRQNWMERCTQSFVSQLNYALTTIGGAMPTMPRVPSLIALLLPQDDCWQVVPELCVTACRCPKGKAGATITIERL